MFLKYFLLNFYGKIYKSFIFLLKQALSTKKSNLTMTIEKNNNFINKKIERIIKESTKSLNFQNESHTKLTMAENHNVILLDSDIETEPSKLNKPLQNKLNEMLGKIASANKKAFDDLNTRLAA